MINNINEKVTMATFRAMEYKKSNCSYVVVITNGEEAVVSLSKRGTEKRLKMGWRVVRTF